MRTLKKWRHLVKLRVEAGTFWKSFRRSLATTLSINIFAKSKIKKKKMLLREMKWKIRRRRRRKKRASLTTQTAQFSIYCITPLCRVVELSNSTTCSRISKWSKSTCSTKIFLPKYFRVDTVQKGENQLSQSYLPWKCIHSMSHLWCQI